MNVRKARLKSGRAPAQRSCGRELGESEAKAGSPSLWDGPAELFFYGHHKVYEREQHQPSLSSDISRIIRGSLLPLLMAVSSLWFALRLWKREVLKLSPDPRHSSYAACRGIETDELKIGLSYLRGENRPKDVSAALFWLKRAAGQGNAQACAELAKIFTSCDVVSEGAFFYKIMPANIEKAKAWAECGVNLGLSEAKGILGSLILSSEKSNDVRLRGLMLVQKGASEGDPTSCLACAMALIKDPIRRDQTDPKYIAGLLEIAAKADIPLGLYLLGIIAEIGYGRAQDIEQAAHSYLAAAWLGNRSAQTRLGCAMLDGHGVQKQPTNGETWLRFAAKHGGSVAACLVGNLYCGTDGLAPNYVEAYRWFYKAAGLGSPLGARVLALMHKLALGGASDGDAGFSHWLNHALLLQRKQVLPDTAILFAGDSICLSRRVDAGDWFKDAAISGDLVALHRLKWAIKLGLNSSYPVVASSNERLPKCA